MVRIYDDSGAALDATFSVVGEHSAQIVYFESRGGGRNNQYGKGLEQLLRRLGRYPAVVQDASVASTGARRLPEAERRIEVEGYPYPIDPRGLADLSQFRVAFGAAQGRIGREPGATGSGNATKRVRLVLGFPEAPVPRALDLEVWLAGRPASAAGYWALLADPNVYRVSDAVAAFQTDLWTVKGDRLAQGDRLIIWQARGSGRQRGVVALGEVLEPAQLTADAANPFWVDRLRADAETERVRVRYVVPPKLPLWLGAPGNELLSQLSVARATGGTVFRVTPTQWAQIVMAAGGWDDRWWHLAENAPGAGAQREGRGQGRGLSAVERKVIENYAMARAKAYFAARKIPYSDVSRNQSYDLHCGPFDRPMYVEVKGTTGAGESILLTFNEVELAQQRHPSTILFVTSGIVLDRTQIRPAASGGRDRVIEPWRPSTESLKPVTYECALPEESADVTRDDLTAPTGRDCQNRNAPAAQSHARAPRLRSGRSLAPAADDPSEPG